MSAAGGSPFSLVCVPFPKRFLFLNVPFAGSHIFNTGPIDGYEKDCPVQLRVHLSPPSKRSQAHSVFELCVFRACCGSDVWNPQHLHVSFLGISTPLPLPRPRLHPHLLLASEMQLLGPYRGEPNGQDFSLFGLPPLSLTQCEAPLCKLFCCRVIMFKWASSAGEFF